MDNENLELDHTNEEVEVDTEETTVDIETEESEVDVDKLQETNKKLYARMKAAEEKLKTLNKPKDTTPSKKVELNNAPSLTDIEATVLKAQGLSNDLLSELKAVAQVRGKSLIDAQSDPLFVAIKEAREKEDKSKQASLGASKGARPVQETKSVSTAGLTAEEHERLWREAKG